MFLNKQVHNSITDPPQGGGGGTAPPSNDFQTLIPEEFRGHPSLQPIKDIPNLVKSYINAQSLVGANRIVVPGTDAKPEEWADFYNKVGRPEDPTKYGLKPPQNLPEGFKVEEGFLKQFAESMHKAGLTTRQAQAMLNDYVQGAANEYTETGKQMTVQRQEQIAALQREWGAAYDTNIDRAKRAVRAFLGDNEIKWLESQGLNTDPNIFRIFAAIGEKLGDPEGGAGDGNRGGMGPITPTQATAEIQNKMMDKEFMDAYMNRQHPGHQAAVEQMLTLHRYAHPQQASAQ